MNNVVLITDKNYYTLTKNLIKTINFNCLDFTIYLIVNGDFDYSDILNNGNIKVLKYDSDKYPYIFKEHNNFISHVSDTTFLKLYLSEILPDNIDKILYIDGDCVVKKNLNEIFNVNIDNYYFGAVKDYDVYFKDRYKYVFNYTNDYYNTGVMLLNIKKMRENNFLKMAYDCYVNNINDILMADQDIFNFTCINEIMDLKPTYNYFITKIKTNPILFDKYKEMYNLDDNYKSYNDVENDSSILHFLGPKKMLFHNKKIRTIYYSIVFK